MCSWNQCDYHYFGSRCFMWHDFYTVSQKTHQLWNGMAQNPVSGFKDEKLIKKSSLHEDWNTQTILEFFKHFCHISSKSIVIILSHTVSKLVRFLGHSVWLFFLPAVAHCAGSACPERIASPSDPDPPDPALCSPQHQAFYSRLRHRLRSALAVFHPVPFVDPANTIALTSGVFTIGPLGPCPPFELRKKISRMAKNATKMRHLQAKISKITKIVATRCQILRPKCTKFDFGWGSAGLRCGSLQRSPRSPSWI